MRKIGLTLLIGVSFIVLITREVSTDPLPRHAQHITSSHHPSGASHVEPHPTHHDTDPNSPHHPHHPTHYDKPSNQGSEFVNDRTSNTNPMDVDWAHPKKPEEPHQQHTEPHHDAGDTHVQGGDVVHPHPHHTGDHGGGQAPDGDHPHSGSGGGGGSDGTGGHVDGGHHDEHADANKPVIDEKNYNPSNDFDDAGGVVQSGKDELIAMGLFTGQDMLNSVIESTGFTTPASLQDGISRLFGGDTNINANGMAKEVTASTTESSTHVEDHTETHTSALPTSAKYNPADWMEDKYAKNYHPSKDAIEVLIDCVPQDEKTGGIDDDAEVDHEVLGTGHRTSRTIPGFNVGPKGNIILTPAQLRLIKRFATQRYRRLSNRKSAESQQQ